MAIRGGHWGVWRNGMKKRKTANVATPFTGEVTSKSG
jgi:hypothetical protein